MEGKGMEESSCMLCVFAFHPSLRPCVLAFIREAYEMREAGTRQAGGERVMLFFLSLRFFLHGFLSEL